MSSIAFFDFVTAINEHDTDRLYELMTPGHTFVDAIGNRITGADNCRQAWTKYFHYFPDYTLELMESLDTGHTVMATGLAMGTYLGSANNGKDHWRIPAAWRAVLNEDQVDLWQVFADTKIPFDIIESHQPASEPAAGDGEGRDEPEVPRATALGGAFFKCRNPEKLREWYARHLGLKTDTYGTTFAWKHWKDPKQKGFTAWSPFPEDTTYFSPSEKEFMFNYRVVHIEKLVARLKEEGVIVLDAIESYPYGKFVHILDPENNKIELWEADDESYGKILRGVSY